MDEQFQTLIFFGIWTVSQISKVWKFIDFSSCKILEICLFTKFKIFKILIVLQIFKISKFANFRNWTIADIFGISQFEKVANISIFLTFVNFQIRNIWHPRFSLFKTLILIPKIFKFLKLVNFPICYNWRIRKMIKYSELFNLKN